MPAPIFHESGNRPRVVIAGAGFAGLWAARRLNSRKYNVLLVDRNNYHTFLPLLYQVASAELEPEQIAYPVRGVIHRLRNVSFLMADIQGLDSENKLLKTDGRDVAYDYLVLALGSRTNFFGVPGASDYSFRLKSLEQGIHLRNHIMSRFESAAWEPDPALQRKALTFAVVGGGPTGVEYAGALSELIRGPLAKDFPRLNIAQARVVLLEASETLLAGFPDKLRDYALKGLGRKNVEVRLGAQVAQVEPDAVHMRDGSALATQTVVWTAGVRGPDLAKDLGLATGPGNRLLVVPTLQAEGRPEIFVVGDLAVIKDTPPLPMIAPVAVQQGSHAARNIKRMARSRPLKDFRYRDKGSMATIGRNAAVVKLGRMAFTGFFAWLVWLFVHLMYLIGFRNRIIVLINWAADYIFFERAVRLVLPKEPAWVKGKRRRD